MRLRDGIAFFRRRGGGYQIECGSHTIELFGLSAEQMSVLDCLNQRVSASYLRQCLGQVGQPEELEQVEQILQDAACLADSQLPPHDDEELRLERRDGHLAARSRRGRMRVRIVVEPCADQRQLDKLRPLLRQIVQRLFDYGVRTVDVTLAGAELTRGQRQRIRANIDPRLKDTRIPTLVVAVFSRRICASALAPIYHEGIDHLLVVVGNDETQVGPLVRIYDGPCAQCLELHERDGDPLWPEVSVEAQGQPLPALGGDLVTLTAMHVARAVVDEVDDCRWLPGETRYFDANLLQERYRWPSHRECRDHLSAMDYFSEL